MTRPTPAMRLGCALDRDSPRGTRFVPPDRDGMLWAGKSKEDKDGSTV